MARYSINNRMAGSQQAITTTLKSQTEITAATATLCRGWLVEIAVGAEGTPNATDCNIVYDVARATTLGTGTAATPNPVGPDVASRSVGTVNHTVEPTVTGGAAFVGSLWSRSLNQRAAQQWFANPGSEIIWPATNLAGLVSRALSPTTTQTVLVDFRYDDL
jgi:hypothetical protein